MVKKLLRLTAREHTERFAPSRLRNRKSSKMDAHTFDSTILREYDIRGQIGKNLCEKDACTLGRAFGTYVIRQSPDKAQHTVCVGYDGRLSSPALESALIEGLLSTGIAIENIGRGPTPMLYFAVQHRKADAGIMVTGSHNPPDYNGFKMTLLDHGVFGPAIQDIGRIAAQGDFINGNGALTDIDISEDYIARLLQDLRPTRDIKVAWDAGNGAAGEILERLTAKTPGEHILLYTDIDGNFPNHHPDPTVDANLKDLQRVVQENACDLGIALDGDGDRIGVVDENGTVLRCDTLMSLYARDILKRHPGAPIIGDVKCSQVMYDEIARLGGKPVMWKTGHSLIKDKMREMKAPLAGELSGHIFFADGYYGFDDALYCGIRLLNELSKQEGGLSVLTKDLPSLYNTPEIRIDVDEAEKFALIPRVLASLKTRSDIENIDTTDGLRVTTKDGWWLLRASNTQNALTLRAESRSEDGLSRLITLMDEEVKKSGYEMP